ncbi:MAG: hypothetical protein HKP61_22750 [Dactylosporangium sp.]|nr:hypothetical protein [Dactylosporangium sp.]NNJ63697.1 hypothetical protein [Dactylosporangium sp.]
MNNEDTQAVAEVGLDDLFGRTGAAPARRSVRSSGARWLLGRLFFALAVSSVIYGLLFFLRLVIPFALLVVTIFMIVLVKYLMADVAAGPLPAEVTGRGIRPLDAKSASGGVVPDERDGVSVAVGRWAGKLALSGNGKSGRTNITEWLGDLADERLRLRHGFTRASDPQRAREMMGEHLWRMLRNPSTGGPTPRDMAALAKRIEEL